METLANKILNSWTPDHGQIDLRDLIEHYFSTHALHPSGSTEQLYKACLKLNFDRKILF